MRLTAKFATYPEELGRGERSACTGDSGFVFNPTHYDATVNGPWKTESQMWREFLRSVDKPLGEGASKPYVSSCPEGTIKGNETEDSIKGHGPWERNRR